MHSKDQEAKQVKMTQEKKKFSGKSEGLYWSGADPPRAKGKIYATRQQNERKLSIAT